MIPERINSVLKSVRERVRVDIEGLFTEGEDREYARRLKQESEPLNIEAHLRRFQFVPCSRLVQMILDVNPERGRIGRNHMLTQ